MHVGQEARREAGVGREHVIVLLVELEMAELVAHSLVDHSASHSIKRRSLAGEMMRLASIRARHSLKLTPNDSSS